MAIIGLKVVLLKEFCHCVNLGFCEQAPLYRDKILNSLRHCVERCDSLHGFLMVFSTGGGTGSGVGTYVLGLLADYYPKIERYSGFTGFTTKHTLTFK